MGYGPLFACRSLPRQAMFAVLGALFPDSLMIMIFLIRVGQGSLKLSGLACLAATCPVAGPDNVDIKLMVTVYFHPTLLKEWTPL